MCTVIANLAILLLSQAGTVASTPINHCAESSHSVQVKILGKCEFANPSGSIKDRIADHIMNVAEQSGKLKPGGTVVAATSGNTGASVAMIAAMKGYKYIGTGITARLSRSVYLH